MSYLTFLKSPKNSQYQIPPDYNPCFIKHLKKRGIAGIKPSSFSSKGYSFLHVREQWK